MSNYFSTEVQASDTSQMFDVFMEDSASAGAGKTGLAFGSVTANYMRQGAAADTAITLAAGTLGTWSSGGWKEIDATNRKGWYQLGVPDAAIAHSSATVFPAYCDIHLVASGAFDTNFRIHLKRNVYHATVNLTKSSTVDEWSVWFYKNGAQLSNTDVTTPVLSLYERDGTNLNAGDITLTYQAPFGWFLNLTTTNRVSAGDQVAAVWSGTIDGSSRTGVIVIGRDAS